MRNLGHRAGWALATSAIAWAGVAEAGETVTYGYDSLGRLVRVERSGTVNNGVKAQYSYDPADNRTNVTVNAAAALPPPPAAPLPAMPELDEPAGADPAGDNPVAPASGPDPGGEPVPDAAEPENRSGSRDR